MEQETMTAAEVELADALLDFLPAHEYNGERRGYFTDQLVKALRGFVRAEIRAALSESIKSL